MNKRNKIIVRGNLPGDLVKYAGIVEKAGYKAGGRVGGILSDLIDTIIDSVVSKIKKNG